MHVVDAARDLALGVDDGAELAPGDLQPQRVLQLHAHAHHLRRQAHQFDEACVPGQQAQVGVEHADAFADVVEHPAQQGLGVLGLRGAVGFGQPRSGQELPRTLRALRRQHEHAHQQRQHRCRHPGQRRGGQAVVEHAHRQRQHRGQRKAQPGTQVEQRQHQRAGGQAAQREDQHRHRLHVGQAGWQPGQRAERGAEHEAAKAVAQQPAPGGVVRRRTQPRAARCQHDGQAQGQRQQHGQRPDQQGLQRQPRPQRQPDQRGDQQRRQRPGQAGRGMRAQLRRLHGPAHARIGRYCMTGKLSCHA